jgi:hypothetical protein
MHTKTPRFQLAHRGCLLRLQSAQVLLVSSLRRLLRVAWFWAARSAAGLGARLDMAVGSESTNAQACDSLGGYAAELEWGYDR